MDTPHTAPSDVLTMPILPNLAVEVEEESVRGVGASRMIKHLRNAPAIGSNLSYFNGFVSPTTIKLPQEQSVPFFILVNWAFCKAKSLGIPAFRFSKKDNMVAEDWLSKASQSVETTLRVPA